MAGYRGTLRKSLNQLGQGVMQIGANGTLIYLPQNASILVQNAPKSLAAEAPHQIPLESLQLSHRPHASLGEGWDGVHEKEF